MKRVPGTTHEVRCLKCGKMLAKSGDFLGIEIKCLRCGTLNRTLEKMIEQVIITDSNGVILFINKAVEKATGYSSAEAIGRRPSDLWGGNMPKKFYVEMWDKILKEKKPLKVTIENKKKSGESYKVDLLVSPILDTKGKVVLYAGIEVVA